ncbi:MAG: VOC family protein, partial [Gemmatimonadetes bacterium]|nr:VOC family protein [Gemmatimonadota bacterium]
GVTAEPGTFCWNELATHAAADAAGFYGQLFGWGTRAQQMPEGTYTVFQQGERQAGGMYEPTEEMAGMPIGWHVYFAVEDCDASADLAKELGARLHVPPSDISDVGRFALVQDPQGAMFSILQPAPTTQAQQAEAEAATAAAV